MKIRLMLLFCLLFGLSGLRGQANDPFSPLVSRDISEKIQEILLLAEEDPQAAIALGLAVQEEGPEASVQFILGNLYFQNEKYPEAAEAYASALKIFPAFRSAKVNLGRIYLIQAQPKETIALYQELVRDGIADAETWLLLGHALMQEALPVAAESAYRQAWLLDLANVEAKRGLLNSLLQQERFSEVRFLSKELLAVDPLRKDYWAAKSHAELALGKNEAALNSLEQARRLGVGDREMLAILGELYLQAEASDEAVLRFKEAFAKGEGGLKRQAQVIEVLLNAELYNDVGELLEQYVRKVDALPVDEQKSYEGSILKFKARRAVGEGSVEEAQAYLRQWLAQAPMDGEGLLMLARNQQSLEQWDAAELTYERAARVKGYEREALVQYAMLQVERQKWDLAIQLLERAQVFEEQEQVNKYLQQLRRMQN